VQTKWREGVIDRVDAGGQTTILRDMFKRETNVAPFLGMRVVAASGEQGTLQAAFGKSGKVRAHFPGGAPTGADMRVALCFRRFVHDQTKSMVQA